VMEFSSEREQKQQKLCHSGTHGPAAEALLDGAEHDAETEDAAGASETAVARVQPPRPSNWGAITLSQKKNWKQQGGRPR